MKCPYCGAEVVGRKCEYCDSDLLEIIREDNLSLEDFDIEKKRGKSTALNVIRGLCHSFIQKHEDEFATYDSNRKCIAGKCVKERLFDVLQIPKGSEIFLIHDDTVFSSGKNGFAITDHGFYCLELFESLILTDFDTIKPDDMVIRENQVICLNRNTHTLTYYSAGGKIHRELEVLCEQVINELR